MVVSDPVPAYVVKTLDMSKNEKVFINVCTDPQVSAPQTLEPSEIAMQVTQGKDWMIPIVVSAGREDVDKKGSPSFVVDCCMHPRVVLSGIEDPSVKVSIVETCIESVEDRYQLVLSRDYKFPRMKVKNQSIKTEFDPGQAKQLVHEDVMLVDEVPTKPQQAADNVVKLQTEPTTTAKPKNIKVLDSNETVFYIHMYRGPYSGPYPRPSHVVEVDGEHHELQLKGNLLVSGTNKSPLPFTPIKYRAFYDGSTSHVMSWKP